MPFWFFFFLISELKETKNKKAVSEKKKKKKEKRKKKENIEGEQHIVPLPWNQNQNTRWISNFEENWVSLRERETEFDRETESPEVRSVLRVHSPQRSVRGEADCVESSGQGVSGAIGGGSGHQGTERAEAWPEEDEEYQAQREYLPQWRRWDHQGYVP